MERERILTYSHKSGFEQRSLLLCITLAFFLFSPAYVFAQQGNTMFLMQGIPQSNQLNPAIQIECKWFVGFPGLTSIHANYANSSFSFNDLATGNNLEFDKVYNMLNRMNGISVESMASAISVAYKNGSDYFTFSVNDRFNSYNTYSKKLAGLLLYGNTQFVGEEIQLRNTRTSSQYYREYSFGWSFQFDRFKTYGIKAKLLFGKANLSTGASRLLLGTDKDTYALSVNGNLAVNSSFPMTLVQNSNGLISNVVVEDMNYWRLLFNPRNVGVAFDAGFIHRYSNELVFSGSILNLGMIIWSDNTYNAKGDVDFVYEGVKEGADFSAAAYFRDLSDSLVNDIIYTVSEEPYITPLPTDIYLAASYRIKKHVSIGLTSRSLFVNRHLHSSITASLNTELLSRFQTSVSWSYMNNSLLNAGAGIAFIGRGYQFHVVTDNFLFLFMPVDVRNINLRFGMNLMLGCPKNLLRQRDNPHYMPVGDCSWADTGKRKRKKR